MNYLALLRGINVGGNSMLRMSELKLCLANAGFGDVRTYIQSGNVLFAAPAEAATRLAQRMEAAIEDRFAMTIRIAVFTEDEWQEIVRSAPEWWGADHDWRHNLLALLPGTGPDEVIGAFSGLQPQIERVSAGNGVVYQSLSLALYGRSTSSKFAAHPLYRRVTVRNHKTARKLAELMRNEKSTRRTNRPDLAHSGE